MNLLKMKLQNPIQHIKTSVILLDGVHLPLLIKATNYDYNTLTKR